MENRAKTYRYRGKGTYRGKLCDVVSWGKFWSGVHIKFEDGIELKVPRGMLAQPDKTLKRVHCAKGRPRL